MDLFGALTPASGPERIHGVVIAVVTQNRDPEKRGRVKLKFPWLSDTMESDWARVAAPGAGAQRGLAAIPEVNDEVLVAFEHGLFDRPYVLGGLWNGTDKPPEGLTDKVGQVWMLRTAKGNRILLADTDNAEKVEIVTATGRSTITLDDKGTITIRAEGDLVIESTQGTVKISGQKVEIRAQADLEVKAGNELKQSGAQTEVQGQAQLTLKGGMVKIN